MMMIMKRKGMVFIIVSDVDRHVIIRNVLNSIFNIFLVFVCQWEYEQLIQAEEKNAGVIKPIQQYNLRGCSVGITDGMDLRITPLRWTQMA
jgi:hypothetical protein